MICSFTNNNVVHVNLRKHVFLNNLTRFVKSYLKKDTLSIHLSIDFVNIKKPLEGQIDK